MTATEHPRQSLPDTLAGGGFSEEFTEHLGALAIHHRKHGEHILGLGITCPCLPTIALSAVPHLETAPLPDTSDVRPSSPARGPECPESALTAPLGATNSPSGHSGTPQGLNGPQSGAEREPLHMTEAEMLKFVAACDGPQGVSADELVLLDGIRGTVEAVTALVALADRLSDKVDRLTAERDRARADLAEARATIARLNARAQVAEAAIAELTGTGKGKAKRVAREIWTRCEESHGLACGTTRRARGTAATLEAENARLTEALYLTRITLEATFRVLQEASGLPDDIDDPDCRDEMVLALRPRAEKAEAENARLVDRIERLSAEYEADLPESMAGDERLRRVFDDHANDVLGLLSDEDEGGE